jgi:hypothetical protein
MQFLSEPTTPAIRRKVEREWACGLLMVAGTRGLVNTLFLGEVEYEVGQGRVRNYHGRWRVESH